MKDKINLLLKQYQKAEGKFLKTINTIKQTLDKEDFYKQYELKYGEIKESTNALNNIVNELARLFSITNSKVDLYKAIDDIERENGLENIAAEQSDENYKWYKVYQSDNKKLIKYLDKRYYIKCDNPDFVNLYIEEDLKFYLCSFKNDNDVSGLIKLGEISGEIYDNSLLDCINIMRKM